MTLVGIARRTPPAADGRHGAQTMALTILARLREAILAENQAIARRAGADHQSFNLRKSQGLLELNRLAAATPGLGAEPAIRAALVDLSLVLEENKRLLRVQFEAAKAVAEIIAQAIRDSQSDGTYSSQSWRGGE